MAIRNIVKDPDGILRKKCRDVVKFDEKLAKLLDDMRQTMLFADGVGLAAPQVGLLRNLAVIEVDELYLELINPVITAQSGEQIDMEGCLSVEGKNAYVKRPMYVSVEFSDRFGERHTAHLEGLAARACCHEIDHLFGILFYDKALRNYSEEE